MGYFDTHAHLDQPEFDADRPQVIERARAAGIEGIVCVGVNAATSQAAIGLAQRYEGVWAAVGIQPNSPAATADWERIVALAALPRVVALGETGLDQYWDVTPLGLQQDCFARHLELARQRRLPLIIHCRDAAAEVLVMLREAAARGPLCGIMHAFSGDAALAAECVELGLHVSFAGQVTYTNKKFLSLRAAAAAVPADRLLIETDSPYLVPHPLRGKLPRNEPANVVHVAQCLAALRGVAVEELAAQTTANARQLFRLG